MSACLPARSAAVAPTCTASGIVCTVVDVVRNNVRRSGPPQHRLPHTSGVAITPIRSPLRVQHPHPAGAGRPTRCRTRRTPSRRREPSSIVPPPMSVSSTRPLTSAPSSATSNTLISARGESLTYISDSSGEKHRPLGCSNSSRLDDELRLAALVGDAEHALEAEQRHALAADPVVPSPVVGVGEVDAAVALQLATRSLGLLR